MSNNYTDICAANPDKKNSRHQIAQAIKHSCRGTKVIHYLGGKNPSTPFENKFEKKRTTFIRYEFKRGTKLPNNYLNEEQFEHTRNIDSLINSLEYLGNKNAVREMEKLKEQFDSMNGCFVSGNVFSKYWKYQEMFPNVPHYFWLDFCGAPTPKLLQEIVDVVSNQTTKEVYVTFYMNHRGKKSVMKIIDTNGRFLTNRAKALKAYCEKLFSEHKNIKCEIFDTYVNGVSPMCVIKFSRTEKIQNKKTIEEYVEASKRFSNKQLAVLWKMPIMKIAGLAAAAKRKKLIK